MFGIGWSEIVVIGVVALIAIGPKQLPSALRTAGYWVGRARRMARDFQNQFQEVLREADVAEMKRHFDEAANAASSMSSPSLFGSVKQDIERALKIDAPAQGATEAAANAPVEQDVPPPAAIASEASSAAPAALAPAGSAPATDKPS